MTNRLTKRELANRLGVGVGRAYERADEIGIRYERWESLRADGTTYTRRNYLRSVVDEALAEWARRGLAS